MSPQASQVVLFKRFMRYNDCEP